jgi:hypothetical protein
MGNAPPSGENIPAQYTARDARPQARHKQQASRLCIRRCLHQVATTEASPVPRWQTGTTTSSQSTLACERYTTLARHTMRGRMNNDSTSKRFPARVSQVQNGNRHFKTRFLGPRRIFAGLGSQKQHAILTHSRQTSWQAHGAVLSRITATATASTPPSDKLPPS